MKIIDRYIFVTLLVSFLICLIGVLALYILLDGFDRLEDFSDYSRAAGVSVWGIFARYYVVRVPLIYVQVAPVIMLLASMFTMTRMVRHNELIPLLASGISTFRIMRFHIIVAIGCTCSMMATQEWILPPLADEIERGKLYDEGNADQVDHRQLFDGQGRVFYIGQVRQFERQMLLVRIVERHPETGRRSVEYEADRVSWREVPGGMLLSLEGGEVRRFARDELSLLDGYPRKFSGAERVEIATDLKANEIIKPRKLDVEFARSARELWRNVREDPNRYTQLMSLHLRASLPLATLVLLALGLPLVVSTETKSFFLGAGICILIAAGFYVCLLAAINLGNKAVLRPGFAAWAPLALFGSLGLSMLRGIRT